MLCQVPERYTLTAHADRGELTALPEKVQPRRLFLAHGNQEAREALSKSIRQKCPNVDVQLPENGSSHTVEKHPGIANGRRLDHGRILTELYDSVLRMGLAGPFSARQLAERYFGTEATTPTTVEFLRLGLLWLNPRFFKRGSDDLFYLRQPV